jgi:hypothetical protein
VKSGVPQWKYAEHLCCLLFMLIILTNVWLTEYLKFADDTRLFRVVANEGYEFDAN